MLGLDTGFGSADPRGAPPLPPLRAMAAGAAVPTGAVTVDSGVTMVRNRTRHAIFARSPTIQPLFALFRTNDNAGGQEAAVVWPEGTVFKASVELTVSTGGAPATALRRLTFGGLDSYVAPAGGTAAPMLSPDPLAASAFHPAFTSLGPGDVVFVKQEIVFPVAGAGMIAIADGTGSSTGVSGEGCYFGGSGSVDLPGALAAQGGTTAAAKLIKPLVILGRHGAAAVLAVGDSIGFGKGVKSSADGASEGSWPVMAAYAAGVPLTKAAISGDRAAAFTLARRSVAISLAAYHSHAIVALGTNDVGTGGAGANLADLVAGVAATLRAANPSLRCWSAKVPLRCISSSDGWTTLAGQSLQSGWGAGQRQDLANAAIATLIGGALDGVIDINAGFADSADAYRWKVNGGASWSTADGTHPTQARQIEAAAIAQPIIASWSA